MNARPRVIESDILTAIAARLAVILATPRERYLPLRVSGTVVGLLDRARADALAAFPDVFRVADDAVEIRKALADADSRSDALHRVARALEQRRALSAWRNERYAVARTLGETPLLLLERAAARYFGIRTYAVHVNGVTERGGETRMWIARRSASKSIDPLMLDNMVGGGIAAQASVASTLVKEAAEEAGIGEALAQSARAASELRVYRAGADGLQREHIFAHDLAMPPGFEPRNVDGEVIEFRCLAIGEVAALIARQSGPDVATADATLVIVDWLARNGWLPHGNPVQRVLREIDARIDAFAR